jgi:hypothetical protein
MPLLLPDPPPPLEEELAPLLDPLPPPLDPPLLLLDPPSSPSAPEIPAKRPPHAEPVTARAAARKGIRKEVRGRKGLMTRLERAHEPQACQRRKDVSPADSAIRARVTLGHPGPRRPEKSLLYLALQ